MDLLKALTNKQALFALGLVVSSAAAGLVLVKAWKAPSLDSLNFPQPVIGDRVWQRIETEVIPTDSPAWRRAATLCEKWNSGFLQIDEEQFYRDRPVFAGWPGARQPGFAWFAYVTGKGNDKPVNFVVRAPPQSVRLPRCKREPEWNSRSSGGVSVCLVVKDEELFLGEWLTYQYYLGVSRVGVYDDGSTDGTEQIAKSFGRFVDYVKWDRGGREDRWQVEQMEIYRAYIKQQLEMGAKWVGAVDVDEYLVFSDPNERLDTFLEKFAERHFHIGSLSFVWKMMHSDLISLPLPAFAALDVMHACKDASDERHHVKTFVRAEAYERMQHPHYHDLKDGFFQYDVSGGVIDPPGPFASRFIPSPARLNHYRLFSLHEWLRKARKRHLQKSPEDQASEQATRLGDYGYQHLEDSLGNCFAVQPDSLLLLNVFARQGCLYG